MCEAFEVEKRHAATPREQVPSLVAVTPRSRLVVIAVGAVAVLGLAWLATTLSDSPRAFAVVVIAGPVVAWGVVILIQYLVNRDRGEE